MTDRLTAELASIAGPNHVLSEAALRAPFETDWTGRFTGVAACVVRPADTGEVMAVLAACARIGVAVVPQGGNTGLVGGGVPRGGEVVLCTRRLDQVSQVDPLTMQITAGAGVTLAAVQECAAGAGLRLPLDFGARDSATIGGMAATNAGGSLAVRHGSMRAQVAGIEAVLAGGRVIERLRGLTKDNVGYDLASLLVGSEGTLAVITRVRMRLTTLPRDRATALLGFPSVGTAVRAQAALRRRLDGLEAIELMLGEGLELVCERMALPSPMPGRHPALLLVESAGAPSQADLLAAAVEDLVEPAADAVLVDDARGRAALWALREAHSEVVTRLGPPPHKLDVTLPLDRIERFIERCHDALRLVDGADTVLTYGHLGDGNLHVNVVGPAPDDGRVDELVLGLVAELGGSISAEHGVGLAKATRLHLGRSQADIEAMRAIKRALDPNGMLNPGVLFA